MIKVPVCYSVFAYDSKPANAVPLQRRENYRQEPLTAQEIADLVGSGHAWRAGIYADGTDSFRKSNVTANQILALDFDACRFAPEQVIDYASNVGIAPSLWYYSYSQNPKIVRIFPRTYKYIISKGEKTDNFIHYKDGYNYRLMWLLERAITSREYEQALQLLLDVFADYGPDKATKDCSRLWYGGSLGAEVLNDEPVPVSSIGALAVHAKVRDGIEPRKALKAKKLFVPDYADVPEPSALTVGVDWYQALQGRCALLDRWRAGDYLDYNERLALFGNLRYLTSTSKKGSILADVLGWYSPKAYEGHTCTEEQIRAKFRDCTLKPVPIVVGRGGTLVTVPEYLSDNAEKPIIPQVAKVSVDMLDTWMDANVPSVLDDKEPGIKVLKSQTGSGKTKRIIDWLLSSVSPTIDKVIYSAPKHSNLKEVEERYKAQAGFSAPRIYRCPEKEVTQQDMMYLSLGLPAKTKSAERKGFIDKLYDEDEPGIYLMTHSLLTSLSGLKADMVIIDEEIDSSLVKTTKLELPALSTIVAYLDSATMEELTAFVMHVRDMDRANGLDIDLSLLRDKIAPKLKANIDDYLLSTPTSCLPVGFFDCLKTDGKLSKGKTDMNCIRITRKSPLIEESMRNNVPIRVFTATPMNYLTENYYSTKIELIEAPLAENRGRIVQYRGVSGARGKDNGKTKPLIDYIKSKLDKDTIDKSLVITFLCHDKSETDTWLNEGFTFADCDGTQIHLANNSGLDCFKGKSIIVAGKYDKPHTWYQDIYDDISNEPSELVRQNQRISLNGVEQNLYLYTEPTMRQMQIQHIQQAVEQAVGRARALRQEGATVYLFCNFCIPDADAVYD